MSDSGCKVLLTRVAEVAGDALKSSHAERGEATAVIEGKQLRHVMERLRDDSQLAFDLLVDLTAVDHLGRSPRFDVVYHLYSIPLRQRLRVKVGVALRPGRLDSVARIWPAANWMEREVFDLFGIGFDGLRDTRRLLLPEDFEGAPLRKDFPREGQGPGSGGAS